VPPSVGYGATGQGSIPPNSLLVFQVQLVNVE
jgi:FKBP-type peptidyl-prolyl cis-trans isomerase